MEALNPYMLYIKLAGAALLLLGAAYASHYVTKAVDDRAYSALQLSQANKNTADVSASLSQLQGFISNMHAAGDGYQADMAAIKADFANLQKEFHNATLKPLPVDCRPDAGRLRLLQDAVSAANKRAGAGQ